jgi:hypothetical protein
MNTEERKLYRDVERAQRALGRTLRALRVAWALHAPTEHAAQEDSRQVRCEQDIRNVLRSEVRITRRDLQNKTHASRVGLALWYSCLAALVANGEARIEQDKDRKNRYWVEDSRRLRGLSDVLSVT